MSAKKSDDEVKVTFHVRSALYGGALALLLGGMSVTLSLAVFPDSAIVRGIAKTFAGGVCEPVQKDLNICEKAIVCYQSHTGMAGIDDSHCLKTLGEMTDE